MSVTGRVCDETRNDNQARNGKACSTFSCHLNRDFFNLPSLIPCGNKAPLAVRHPRASGCNLNTIGNRQQLRLTIGTCKY